MDEAAFQALVQGLRTEASHWFNNAALLELERLIRWAEWGFDAHFQENCTVRELSPPPLDNPPST